MNFQTTADIHGEKALTAKPRKILHSIKLQSTVNSSGRIRIYRTFA